VSLSPIAAVLGRLPSGLFVLTARRHPNVTRLASVTQSTGSSLRSSPGHSAINQAADETGMLASWVMQAGFQPPMITVALHKDRLLAQWLAEAVPFTVNVLSQEQRPLLAHFGHGFEEGEPAFEGLEIERTSNGAPVLAGTVGFLECEPAGHLDSADHRIFLARVTAGHLNESRRPLVHVRKNGMKY
jgi:flavin reductase (DIM6/NTAB) family NADH-FMN oxidoreductase RutF